MQWGGQRNPFAHCTLVQSARGGAPKGIFLFLPQLAFLVLQYFVDYKVGNTTERLICKIALDY